MKSGPLDCDVLTRELAQLANGNFRRKPDQIRAIVQPGAVFGKHAANFAKRYSRLQPSEQGIPQKSSIEVLPYEGTNEHVLRMRDYLKRRLESDLMGAFVHGSLGTGEEVAYSDFDALVIIKDEVLREGARLRNVAYRLNKARGMMFDCDPLQHHGWFVLPQSALQCFPEHIFPIALFAHTRSILVEQTPVKFDVHPFCEHESLISHFTAIAQSSLDELNSRRYIRNIYNLKSTLSKLMLLPALYVQSSSGVGIFKKDSFRTARRDFAESDWKIMDEISQIRREWQFTPPRPWKWLAVNTSVIGTVIRRRCAPKIDADLLVRLDDTFACRCSNLVNQMRQKVATIGQC